MNLTLFCKKVQIYLKYMLLQIQTRKEVIANYELNDITIDNRFHLINFVSSRMNTKEFDNAMKILFHVSCLYDRSRWTRWFQKIPKDQLKIIFYMIYHDTWNMVIIYST